MMSHPQPENFSLLKTHEANGTVANDNFNLFFSLKIFLSSSCHSQGRIH